MPPGLCFTSAEPAAPAAPVQNSAFDKVGALLGGGVPSQDTKLATFMASMGKWAHARSLLSSLTIIIEHTFDYALCARQARLR
jgi:hypothetical protein